MTRNEKAIIRIIDVQLLLREEHSKAEIARRLNVSYETVRRHIKEYTNPMTREIAIRDSLLWVGIQVERRNLQMIEGQAKIEAILSLMRQGAGDHSLIKDKKC